MNAFHALLLGLKMLPAYMAKDYVEFFEEFGDRTEEEKEMLLREAVSFVELSEDEVKALLSFTTDANGIPYSSANVKNLEAGEIFERIVAVCMEIGRIEINLVSNEEKKSLKGSQSIPGAFSQGTPI